MNKKLDSWVVTFTDRYGERLFRVIDAYSGENAEVIVKEHDPSVKIYESFTWQSLMDGHY